MIKNYLLKGREKHKKKKIKNQSHQNVDKWISQSYDRPCAHMVDRTLPHPRLGTGHGFTMHAHTIVDQTMNVPARRAVGSVSNGNLQFIKNVIAFLAFTMGHEIFIS